MYIICNIFIPCMCYFNIPSVPYVLFYHLSYVRYFELTQSQSQLYNSYVFSAPSTGKVDMLFMYNVLCVCHSKPSINTNILQIVHSSAFNIKFPMVVFLDFVFNKFMNSPRGTLNLQHIHTVITKLFFIQDYQQCYISTLNLFKFCIVLNINLIRVTKNYSIQLLVL